MKLLNYFKDFLDCTVNLNQTRLDLLDQRVQGIVSCLEDDSVIGTLIEDHIPQGSWAHRTIIRPLPGDEFDADFLLLLTEAEDWSANPRVYLNELRAAFRRSSTYRDMVHRKNRCVRVGYAGDCHIDVVPHMRLADGRQVIVNWAEDKFEDTNPEGFTAWMKEKDELANGNLRKIIRLLKFLRDYKNTFTVPSVILTTLLGERVQAWDAENRYRDVPTTLKNVIADLDTWLELHPSMPTIEDPSCPGTTFNHRWDEDDYSNFQEQIAHYSDKITSAYEEADKDKSLALWQEVFGPEFRRSTREAGGDLAKVSTRAVRRRDPGEEFIDEQPGLMLAGGYRLRIECKVERKVGFRHGNLRQMRSVGKGRTLRFSVADCDVPEPFQVWWKVKNREAEAAMARDLRGKLVRDDGSRSRVEHTKYKGWHYVECYIVKNGQVLATDRHTVNIT